MLEKPHLLRAGGTLLAGVGAHFSFTPRDHRVPQASQAPFHRWVKRGAGRCSDPPVHNLLVARDGQRSRPKRAWISKWGSVRGSACYCGLVPPRQGCWREEKGSLLLFPRSCPSSPLSRTSHPHPIYHTYPSSLAGDQVRKTKMKRTLLRQPIPGDADLHASHAPDGLLSISPLIAAPGSIFIFCLKLLLCWFNQLNEGPISLCSCPEKPKKFQMKSFLQKSDRSVDLGTKRVRMGWPLLMIWQRARLVKKGPGDRASWQEGEISHLEITHQLLTHSSDAVMELLPQTRPHGRIQKSSWHRTCLHVVKCEVDGQISVK